MVGTMWLRRQHLVVILALVTMTTRVAESCTPSDETPLQTLYTMSSHVISGKTSLVLDNSDGSRSIQVKVFCQFKGETIPAILNVSVPSPNSRGLCADIKMADGKRYIMWLRKSADKYIHLAADPLHLNTNNIEKVKLNCGVDVRIITDMKKFPGRSTCTPHVSPGCPGYNNSVTTTKVPAAGSDDKVDEVEKAEEVDEEIKIEKEIKVDESDKSDEVKDINKVGAKDGTGESKSCGQLLAPPTSMMTLSALTLAAAAAVPRL